MCFILSVLVWFLSWLNNLKGPIKMAWDLVSIAYHDQGYLIFCIFFKFYFISFFLLLLLLLFSFYYYYYYFLFIKGSTLLPCPSWLLGASWSPQNHSYPEKMFPSNVLISLEAEKNPLSLIKNPHKSPFRNFFLWPFKSGTFFVFV